MREYRVPLRGNGPDQLHASQFALRMLGIIVRNSPIEHAHQHGFNHIVKMMPQRDSCCSRAFLPAYTGIRVACARRGNRIFVQRRDIAVYSAREIICAGISSIAAFSSIIRRFSGL
jgi:hypothetical protein